MRGRHCLLGGDEVGDVEKETQGQHRGPRRRGRRPTPPDPGSGPVGAFADRLWRLKQDAGDPSYEEMSVRLGAAASKSSLAAAAQGRSLPSWETTWEFVRVLAVDRLGHDPRATEKEWRDRWIRTRAAGQPTDTTSAADVAPEPAAETATAAGVMPEPAGVAATSTASEATPRSATGEVEEPGRARRRRVGVGVGAAVAALAGAVLAVVMVDRQTGGSDAGVTPPVAASPDHDDSRFEGDITYPDGSLVPPDSSFTKVWRIRNTGTVPWANRYLARVNDAPCQAPTAVAIPQTSPGEAVDIAVTVRTPSKPGHCKIYWKMADEQGRTHFPLKRPVFLDVRVGGS
ncbi:NBR1-Ig-like domain-containing protein [Micromonospora sp. NPDC047707]|uniref:NBR1-Ig-like domain-containing protein n=1 Tax=Micromonospora sp. NPDC047707 TaxID=3154498 RepID=UPI003453CCCB